MRDEQKFLSIIALVITSIVIVSLNPEFTGSVVGERETGVLAYDNVLPGSTAIRSLTVQYDSVGPVLLEIGTTGQAASWIVLSEDNYQLYPGVEHEIPISVVVPRGTEEGAYTATLVLMRVQNSDETSILNDQVLEYVDVEITVAETRRDGFSLTDLTVYDVEQGQEIPFSITILNEGNTNLDKDVSLTVTDASGAIVAEEKVEVIARALEEKEILGGFDSLPKGRYTVLAVIDGVAEEASFVVHEPDSLMRRADLVYSDVAMDGSGVVQIVAVVRNTGDIPLTVSLGGIVAHDEGIRSIRSGSQQVLPGHHVVLADSYREEDSGRFDIHLEVLSGTTALLQKDTTLYSSNAIDLEANFAVVFGLVIILLIVTHYVLSRRRRDE